MTVLIHEKALGQHHQFRVSIVAPLSGLGAIKEPKGKLGTWENWLAYIAGLDSSTQRDGRDAAVVVTLTPTTSEAVSYTHLTLPTIYSV